MKRVTIYDVAKEAGVSLATVSRVINDSTVVKSATKQKVEDAIMRLGYKPNAIAQGLALQKTTMIGLIVPDTSFIYTGQIINGLLDVSKIYKQMLEEANCDIDISNITLAREIWDRLADDQRDVFASTVIRHCAEHCNPLLPNGLLTILLIDDNGKIYEV